MYVKRIRPAQSMDNLGVKSQMWIEVGGNGSPGQPLCLANGLH